MPRTELIGLDPTIPEQPPPSAQWVADHRKQRFNLAKAFRYLGILYGNRGEKR